MNSRCVVVLWTLAIACVQLGCNTKPAGSRASATAPASTKVHSGPRLEQADCLAFAKELETAADAGDTSSVAARFDWSALLQTSASGLGLPAKTLEAYEADLKKQMQAPGSLAGVIANAKKQGGSFRLRNVQTSKQGASVLFRLLLGSAGGVNYFRFSIARRPSGQIRIVDFYNFMTGENSSQTIRRSDFIPLAARQSSGIVERLTGVESDTAKSRAKIQELIVATRTGRSGDVLALYRQLPASLQKDKTYLVLRLIAAQKVGEKEYAEAIDAFRAAYPGDPSLDLISIDGLVFKKQFDELLRCIDRLNETVGGDPYLSVLRANVLAGKDDLAAAEAAAEDAVKAEPTLREARWALITIALNRHEFDKVLEQLRNFERDFQLRLDAFDTNPTYAEFVKSPQYQEWLKDHSATTK